MHHCRNFIYIFGPKPPHPSHRTPATNNKLNNGRAGLIPHDRDQTNRCVEHFCQPLLCVFLLRNHLDDGTRSTSDRTDEFIYCSSYDVVDGLSCPPSRHRQSVYDDIWCHGRTKIYICLWPIQMVDIKCKHRNLFEWKRIRCSWQSTVRGELVSVVHPVVVVEK